MEETDGDYQRLVNSDSVEIFINNIGEHERLKVMLPIEAC